ncbi:hypothetical protein SERLA73DRAFT_189518 [Serpula lacrymans var. lacrymans S7.3]|uniref:DUF6533 domain-containing protein n=2 Tax=Serpula lacrymans var. lacrymans TaxID=341189 RepID=F8QDT6_SERL3|nr:uncharacterized protein SERLADRAFT_480361 [Serpula lacrymans var. lacrymans S7.9]EGN93757.1 hypothetical protein SERLA73DRAFT_189518 [Serpula lacrymans var. lacrymans S7.3]EGO19129.1 hypothetical protein SERLADRAFT_480361 [Serpula lacrymans var. lacrymans S7.9]
MSATSSSISFLWGLQVSSYFNVAGFAILVYDYCITLETEMRCIWGTRWNTLRITFGVARYLPFAIAALDIYFATVTHTGNCNSLNRALFGITILGTVAAEVLLIQRTYIFWKGNKNMLAWLLGFAVFLGLVAFILPNELEKYAPTGYINSDGCLFITSRQYAIVYGVLILYELVMLCLIVCSPMTVNIYRNAIMYIGCIICEVAPNLSLLLLMVEFAVVTLIDLIVTVLAPVPYTSAIVTLQSTMHSILSSRVLFDLCRTEALESQSLIH